MHWMKGKETLNAFASLSQASDQLICINHLVYSLRNQRGDIIYRLVSCYPYHLALVPEFFCTALISSESICVMWTTVITPLRRLSVAVRYTTLLVRRQRVCTGLSMDWWNNTDVQSRWKFKAQSCAAQTGFPLLNWLCLLTNKSFAAMQQK